MSVKQNKSQFVVDNYVEVNGIKELSLLTAGLNCAGILYVVEPWGGGATALDGLFRVYVRKDVAHILKQHAEDAARCV